MLFQAHRGVSSDYPENTMPAFVAALREGYQLIELDLKVTSDSKFVLLHDWDLSRTARLASGERLSGIVKIGDITYSEAQKYDYGLWFSEKFRGTKIPLLEEVLDFARREKIKIKIDNCYRAFSKEHKKLLFDILRDYEDVASLTCFTTEELREAAGIFGKMEFHYDGAVDEERLKQLGEILPKERLTVWLPHRNPNTTWVQVEFANETLSKMVKRYARLGVWILSTAEDLMDAKALGADVIETNGTLKPTLI